MSQDKKSFSLRITSIGRSVHRARFWHKWYQYNKGITKVKINLTFADAFFAKVYVFNRYSSFAFIGSLFLVSSLSHTVYTVSYCTGCQMTDFCELKDPNLSILPVVISKIKPEEKKWLFFFWETLRKIICVIPTSSRAVKISTTHYSYYSLTCKIISRLQYICIVCL